MRIIQTVWTNSAEYITNQSCNLIIFRFLVQTNSSHIPFIWSSVQKHNTTDRALALCLSPIIVEHKSTLSPCFEWMGNTNGRRCAISNLFSKFENFKKSFFSVKFFFLLNTCISKFIHGMICIRWTNWQNVIYFVCLYKSVMAICMSVNGQGVRLITKTYIVSNDNKIMIQFYNTFYE